MAASLFLRPKPLSLVLGAASLGTTLFMGLTAGQSATTPPTTPKAHVPVAITLQKELGASEQSRAALWRVPNDVEVTFLVQDLVTGEVRESQAALKPMIPASTTKLVTAAATLGDLNGLGGWWSTELTVPSSEWGQAEVSELTLSGSVDPTLSLSGTNNSLQALAVQASAKGLRQVGVVRLDDDLIQPDSWQGSVIDTPMVAFMPQEWLENRPTHAEAFAAEIRTALIDALEDAGITVENNATPSVALPTPQTTEQEGIASVKSDGPAEFLAATLRPSDNLRAEELLASAGAQPDGEGTLQAAGTRAVEILSGWGIDTRGATLHDGSGLSRENRLSARTLVDLLEVMYRTGGTGQSYADPLAVFNANANSYAEALPHAGVGGSKYGRGGTLNNRLVGTGLDVRAKTGTLPGSSNLAGYVMGHSGHPLAFAIHMNGPETAPILELRAAQDEWIQAIAAQY